MPKVSVIVPVKNDKRLIDLIKALEKQTFKDFEVLIADDSEKKIFNEKTSLNLRYFHTKPMKITEKLHFLAKKANSNIIAVTESDCIPSETWLEDLLSEYKDDKTIIVGVQQILSPYNVVLSYGSLLIPKNAFKIQHDAKLSIADDTDWFFTLEENGYSFFQINKGVVFHYKDPVKRLFRSFAYAKDNAYIYIKHNKDKRIIKSILFQSATIFFSFVTILTLIVFGIYYKLRKIFLKKLR
ncbi:MAG: glycosyltransferase family A protein [Candidatus Aenigmatarchaeota archaeon]|nr:glycosyltransferase family 2 protein [Candidatus Aenigmarchaeota archaeon]